MTGFDPFAPHPPAVDALMSTLAYADIFDHPLRFEEIRRYFPHPVSPKQLGTLIEVSRPLVECLEGYYVLAGRSAIVQARIRREAASRELWRRARPWMHVAAALPWFRMVAVTGSLAVQSAGESEDIDLFIVTAPGFLWVSRGMILVLARLARPLGLRLCPNYLVTERALELPAHSLYTARELAQMVPLSGFAIYDRMRRLNPWTGDYLPNAGDPPASPMHLDRALTLRVIQRILEAILAITPLRVVERFEMRRKISRLRREQGASPEVYFSADVCKGHDQRHGLRIETQLMLKLAEMESTATAASALRETGP